jgi:hypothetical protein
LEDLGGQTTTYTLLLSLEYVSSSFKVDEMDIEPKIEYFSFDAVQENTTDFEF